MWPLECMKHNLFLTGSVGHRFLMSKILHIITFYILVCTTSKSNVPYITCGAQDSKRVKKIEMGNGQTCGNKHKSKKSTAKCKYNTI